MPATEAEQLTEANALESVFEANQGSAATSLFGAYVGL